MSIFANLFGFDLFGSNVGNDPYWQQQQAQTQAAARAKAEYERQCEIFRRNQGNVIEGECRRVENDDEQKFLKSS